jgi:hypothetical protein
MKYVKVKKNDELYVDLGRYGLFIHVDVDGEFYDIEYVVEKQRDLVHTPADMVTYKDGEKATRVKLADGVRIWRHREKR